MNKPRLFIGSSVEQLELAYAAQVGLEHNAEVTVWPQGVFKLSRMAMSSLLQELEQTDFAVFIFSPDDVQRVRESSQNIVRDNVVFELGLFIGRLGIERCFMFVPRDTEEFHLPSDLLGLIPGTFEPNRQDKNLTAALGPACTNVRKAVAQLGFFKTSDALRSTEQTSSTLISDPGDCAALIQSWLGGRPRAENLVAIKFLDVDRQLGLAPGSAEKFIADAAFRWGLRIAQRGKDIVLFEPT